MKAGIVLDAWKLPIFERRLKEAGFTYTGPVPMTDDTLILTVETGEPNRLSKVVLQCQNEAAAFKATKH